MTMGVLLRLVLFLWHKYLQTAIVLSWGVHPTPAHRLEELLGIYWQRIASKNTMCSVRCQEMNPTFLLVIGLRAYGKEKREGVTYLGSLWNAVVALHAAPSYMQFSQVRDYRLVEWHHAGR